MRLLRLALCSDQNTEQVEIPEELLDSAELLEKASVVGSQDPDLLEAEQALESFFEYSDLQTQIKSDGLQNTKLATAINDIYRPRLTGSFVKDGVSIESFAENIATEGVGDNLRNFLDGFIQLSVVDMKHKWNAIADFFSSTSTQIGKYEEKLATTRREYDKKKSDFREGEHHLYLGELHYFFMKDKGVSVDILGDLHSDIDHSRFILVSAPKAALETLGKVRSLIGSKKIKQDSDVVSLVKNIEKLPGIGDIFPNKHRGEKILFNATSVMLVRGGTRKPVTLNDIDHQRLADLARKDRIKEVKSKGHTVFKAITNTWAPAKVGSAVGAALVSQKVTSAEIGDIISAGQQYLKNIDDFYRDSNALHRGFEDIERALQGMFDHGGSLSTESLAALKQVVNYVQNIMSLFYEPSVDEILRSIRGAKYCNYLARSVIYNAKEYF